MYSFNVGFLSRRGHLGVVVGPKACKIKDIQGLTQFDLRGIELPPKIQFLNLDRYTRKFRSAEHLGGPLWLT